MAQEILESTLRGAVVVRLCRCLEDCAAAPNSPGPAASDFAGPFAAVGAFAYFVLEHCAIWAIGHAEIEGVFQMFCRRSSAEGGGDKCSAASGSGPASAAGPGVLAPFPAGVCSPGRLGRVAVYN